MCEKAAALRKLLREDNTLEKITVAERQIRFSYSNADMFARLIEGDQAVSAAVVFALPTGGVPVAIALAEGSYDFDHR